MRFGESVNSLEEYIPFSYKPNMIRLDANESSLDLPENMIKGITEVVSIPILTVKSFVPYTVSITESTRKTLLSETAQMN